MRVKPPPSRPLKFQGRLEWPLEPGVDDWGLNAEQQETYVELFRRILAARNAWSENEHDFFVLRRFLRARSYDLEKATAMWMNDLQWRKEFGTDRILEEFHFPERDAFLSAYPQGYHKVDKMGRPIFIQLLGKIDIAKLKKVCSEERMVRAHIQGYEYCLKVIMPICSRLAGRHIDQTFQIMDVSGVGLSHLTGETKRFTKLITHFDHDHYPETLGHICIINAPNIFKVIWSVVKGFIDPRTQGKIEILGTDYRDTLLRWVDEANLPDWLGGKSQGSLLDDVGPWSDAELCSSIGVSIQDLLQGRRVPPPKPLCAAVAAADAADAVTAAIGVLEAGLETGERIRE